MSDSDSDDSSVDGVGAILPIPQQDVRRIVSGQVISDMSSAVKELLDNAVDAGATSINVRLFNQGLDVIEVSDDGTGVPKHSRPLLAMKHATSKIINFDDLYKDVVINGQIQPHQLGFRGEALFSLVQISQKLIVCTRTETEETAQQMQFNRDGYLDPNSVQEVARKVGTTVAIVKLFDKLPVRRADMVKRLKAQRAKLLRLIQAYAVLCVGVRFNVYDKSGPGYAKTSVLMSTTDKSKSIKATISSVFGSSFLSGLTNFRVDLSTIVEKSLGANKQRATKNSHESDVHSSDEQTLEQTLEQTKNLWRIEGMVSNAPNSNSRSSVATEIQFFSINGRPVDLPKLTRVIADVWRNFESVELSKKRAACIIGLYLPNSMFDVNVSPDKREVFFSSESEICDLVRDGLFKLWSSQTEGTFTANIVHRESNDTGNQSTTFRKAIQCKELSSEPGKLYPLDEKVETFHANSKRHPGRMKRRNAFINDPESVGKCTTDAHAAKIVSATNGHCSKSLSAGADVDPQIVKCIQNKNDNEAYLKVPARVVATTDSNLIDDINMKKRKQPQNGHADDFTLSLERKKKRQNEEMEKRIWNQTKLNFMHAESVSQDEEIRKLKSLQRISLPSDKQKVNKYSETLRVDSRDHANGNQKEKPITVPQDCSLQSFTTSGTNVSIKSTSVSNSSTSDTSQQSTKGPQATDEPTPPQASQHTSRETEISNSESSQTDDNSSNQIISCPKEKVRSPQISSEHYQRLETSYSPTTSSNIHPSSPTATKITPQTLSYPSSQSPDSKDTNQQSLQKDGVIVWDAFKNTDIVAEKAKSMYIDVMKRRQMLKEIQQSKSSRGNDMDRIDDDDDDDDSKDDNLGRVVKLSKEDFLTMKVIGQFNLGFILALSEKGELWILDQHACDEQYNFERLCRETKIHEQKLLKPLPLELSPSEENCILENLQVFEQNGFKFSYDETKQPRHRLSLTALPHSGSGGDGRKAVQFGKEDVGALCALLGADGASSSTVAGSGTGVDGSGSQGNNAVRRHARSGSSSSGAIIRLPKSIAMFASRACRSSIMIGDALSEKKMEEVIKRLNALDQPWTCPHGRPTIRHIKDMLDDLIQDEKKSSKVVAGEIAALSQYEYDDEET